MRTLAISVHSIVDAMNKFTWTTEVLWRKRDGTAVGNCPAWFQKL